MWKDILAYAELPKYLLALALFLSTGLQIWNNYKQQKLEDTISLQLEGVLTANATKISELQENINSAKSKMISYSDMENRTEDIISQIGNKTEALEKHLNETDSKILSYSQRFSRIEKTLKGGKIKVQITGQKTTEEIKAPTSEWNGIDADDFLTCVHYYDPDKCPSISYSWETNYKNGGQPVGAFRTENLWLSDFGNLDLNLAFKIDVVTYGENQDSLGSGGVQNQGVYIKAGYFSESGEFITLVEDKMLEGDPNLDPKFFYVPTVPYGHSKKYKTFEPAYYAGLSTLPNQEYDMGVQVGGSFLNLLDAKLRMGGVGYISNTYFGAGLSISYHPKLGGKYLNFAPNVSYLFSSERNNLSLGLLFQVW